MPENHVGQRAAVWKLRTQSITFPPMPRLMGILNVTPDSFSDGGKFVVIGKAVEHALQLVADGADILDIGGESTRPYATPVSAQEEMDRVLPVIEKLSKRTDVPLSIDTSKAIVAKAAIAAGAEIINDITAFLGDSEMLPLAVTTKAGVCAMHMSGTPQTMQDDPTYENVVQTVIEFLSERKNVLLKAGISSKSICLDPGIGFGKKTAHNKTLLHNCHRLHALRCPILVGHSRKGFIGKILNDMKTNRVAGTIGISLALALQGIQILRVHDVRETNEALTLFKAVGGFRVTRRTD